MHKASFLIGVLLTSRPWRGPVDQKLGLFFREPLEITKAKGVAVGRSVGHVVSRINTPRPISPSSSDALEKLRYQRKGRGKKIVSTPLQSWAATCYKGFVKCFLNVPLACLGSMAAAVQPNGLSFRKQFTKPSEQVAAPDCRVSPSSSLSLQNSGSHPVALHQQKSCVKRL